MKDPSGFSVNAPCAGPVCATALIGSLLGSLSFPSTPGVGTFRVPKARTEYALPAATGGWFSWTVKALARLVVCPSGLLMLRACAPSDAAVVSSVSVSWVGDATATPVTVMPLPANAATRRWGTPGPGSKKPAPPALEPFTVTCTAECPCTTTDGETDRI